MLDTLRRIVQEVNNAPDIRSALDLMAQRVRDAMGTEVCSIYLRDNDRERYVLMASEGLKREAVGRVSLAAFQPFFFYQLQDGWYTGTAPIWNYDFNSDNYSVPVGARLGKVVKGNKAVFNFFVEPQVSVADRGPGQPEWQLFFAMNMQFM